MREERPKIRIYQPFKLPIRFTLWALWGIIAVGVITIGSRSVEGNHPVGLLLLGSGLAASGILAAFSLLSSAFWERLIQPELDARNARIHLYVLVGLGVIGGIMIAAAVSRLI